MTETLYKTPLGELCLIASDGKLVYCNWATPDCEIKRKRLIKKLKSDLNDNKENEKCHETNSRLIDEEILKSTINQLDSYFNKERREFTIPLKIFGTPFQTSVLNIIAKIPFGETYSYEKICQAIMTGKGFRAVAQACSSNPISIIVPCHRVVSKNGKIGGYTGGVDKKIALLEHEKTENDKN